VAGLDETVPLPVDVEWETVSAEYKDCELVVSDRRPLPPPRAPRPLVPSRGVSLAFVCRCARR
jgi:hypothetical protein